MVDWVAKPWSSLQEHILLAPPGKQLLGWEYFMEMVVNAGGTVIEQELCAAQRWD